jgi:hypothetical protein
VNLGNLVNNHEAPDQKLALIVVRDWALSPAVAKKVLIHVIASDKETWKQVKKEGQNHLACGGHRGMHDDTDQLAIVLGCVVIANRTICMRCSSSVHGNNQFRGEKKRSFTIERAC